MKKMERVFRLYVFFLNKGHTEEVAIKKATESEEFFLKVYLGV